MVSLFRLYGVAVGGANGPRFVTNTFEAAFTSSAMLPSQAALPYYGAQKTGSLTSLPGSITLSQFSYFRITPLILLD